MTGPLDVEEARRNFAHYTPRELAERFYVLCDEVERLRAGESDEPAEENVQPTPGQLLARLFDSPLDERLLILARVLDNASEAAACFERNHEGRIRSLEAQLAAARTAARVFNDEITSYMLGDVDGAAVARAQSVLTAAVGTA